VTATSGMRVPVVAGVGGGVGTTTVAVGLRGHDGGRTAGRRPDILVCCDTLDSMQRAAEVLDAAGPEPPPVLAVTLAGRTLRGALRQRLELLEPDAAGLVLLPHVRRWSTLPDPLAEVARLLVDPADRLPRPVRAYAAALRELVAAVAASGRLGSDPVRPARPPHPDERHVRPPGFDERHARHGAGRGPGAGTAAVPSGWSPDERHGRRTGSDEGAVRRETGGGAPYPGPPGSRPAHPDPAPQPRRGVRIVAPAGRVEQAG